MSAAQRGPTIAAVKEALARWQPSDRSRSLPTDAAVAAILRERDGAVEMLFIRRAKHPRDPWSGQMAWPGGHVDRTDGDALAAALREAREEVGLDLQRDAILLGRLSTVRTHLPFRKRPRGVTPFLFELRTDVAPTPNEEVEEALFIPLSFFLDRSNRSSLLWAHLAPPKPYPCYRYQGRVVWGLTLRMLDELLELLGHGGGQAPALRT